MLGMIDDRQVAEVLAPGQHRRDDAARGEAELRDRRNLARRAAMDNLLQHGLDRGRLLHLRWGAMVGQRLLPVPVGHAAHDMAGQQVETCVLQRDRAFHQLAERLDDRIKPLRVEGQVGELAVDLNRPPELDVLPVDDALQDGVHDLKVGDVLGDPDQGEAQLVGLVDHGRRDPREVPLRFDHQARRPGGRQGWAPARAGLPDRP